MLLIGKDADRYISLREELIEFDEIFTEETSDRSVAIVGAAFLDTLLEKILLNVLVDDDKEVRRLLQPDGALGTYGSRTSLVYCLGLIGKIVRDDLRRVGKIRNHFAHNVRMTFDEPKMRQWCKDLHWHEVSMCMTAPEGAIPRDLFQVGVNQLVCYLNGIVGLALTERRATPTHS